MFQTSYVAIGLLRSLLHPQTCSSACFRSWVPFVAVIPGTNPRNIFVFSSFHTSASGWLCVHFSSKNFKLVSFFQFSVACLNNWPLVSLFLSHLTPWSHPRLRITFKNMNVSHSTLLKPSVVPHGPKIKFKQAGSLFQHPSWLHSLCIYFTSLYRMLVTVSAQGVFSRPWLCFSVF